MLRTPGIAALGTALALAAGPAAAAGAPLHPDPLPAAPHAGLPVTATPSDPRPVAPADDLATLEGFPFAVRYSPGHEAPARAMAARVASVLEHFAPRLGITPEVELLVLAEAHWATHGGFPVYGMPHIMEGRRLVVAAGDNPFWQSQLPDPATLSPEAADALRSVYGDGRGGLTGAPFFDLLAVHELGHAYHQQARVRMQRNWMGEFFPNLLLHTWAEEVAPEFLPALTLLPDLMVARGPGDFEFTTLEEIEAGVAAVVYRNPENYGWYQVRWHQGARRVHEAGGGEVLDRLWAALRDTPERLDDEAFLAMLDTRVHPSVADIVRNWDRETASPPAWRPRGAGVAPGTGTRIHPAAPGGTRPLPVIDMHLHALSPAEMGPVPLAMCTPFVFSPPWDPGAGPMAERFFGLQKAPPCDDPVWSPETDDGLMHETLEALERLNVYAVTSGAPHFVRRWRAEAPERIIPAITLQMGPGAPSIDTLRAMHERGELAVLGEITTQYQGIHPADEALAPYWALAEELDIPVGIHVGTGPPGVAYMGFDGYRARLHSALTMEEVLLRHPGLRVYLMHAGYPLLDDLMALLYAHPQVYVDVGVIVFTVPRPALYRYLQTLVEAGYGQRILFGSDQMAWPGVIERSIAVIQEAPFLTEEQKRDILYHNAARFLRLSEEEVARHHGGEGR